MESVKYNQALCDKYGIIIGEDTSDTAIQKLNNCLSHVSSLFGVVDLYLDIENLGFHIGEHESYNYIGQIIIDDNMVYGFFANNKSVPVAITPTLFKTYRIFK